VFWGLGAKEISLWNGAFFGTVLFEVVLLSNKFITESSSILIQRTHYLINREIYMRNAFLSINKPLLSGSEIEVFSKNGIKSII